MKTDAAPREPRELTRPGRLWVVAVSVGVALGLFSTVADGILTARLITTLGNIAAPWGLAAFLVGLRARSPMQGALAGGVALAAGIATYYGIAVVRGYVVGAPTLAWTAVAAAAGPVMGLAGAVVATGRSPRRVLAVAAPSAMLLAEAIFLMLDRKVWRYNLLAEPYRWVDLLLIVVLVLGAVVLPMVFVPGRRERRLAYGLAAAFGAAGSVGFVFLLRMIAGT